LQTSFRLRGAHSLRSNLTYFDNRRATRTNLTSRH